MLPATIAIWSRTCRFGFSGVPPAPLLLPLVCYGVAMVARGADAGNQLPCPGLSLFAKASRELARQKRAGRSSPVTPLLLPRLWELPLPGAPWDAWTQLPSAPPGALGPVGAGRLTQEQPLAKEVVAGAHHVPLATGHLRGGDALRAAVSSSGKFPGPKWGQKRLVQGKNVLWLFAQGSCLLSPVFSSATELFCNAGNFTCLLCASVFLITRHKIIQASFPREPRGFVNEHDKVLWDPWLKAQP